MTLDEIRKALADRRIDKVMVATGLSRTTIAEIRDGKNLNPTLETVEKLVRYFRANA